MGFAGNIRNPCCRHTGTYCVFGILNVVVVLSIPQTTNKAQVLNRR